MSRIGKKPISIPDGVTLSIQGNVVTIKGSKGELSQEINSEFKLEENEGEYILKRPTEQKRHRALHGLYRSLINNAVVGVSEGYKKELELIGVGYRASTQGNVLDLTLGYSHNIVFQIPSEVKVTAESAKGKAPTVILESVDKQLVGQVAAKLRSLRKIEPYKGKGIKFVGEEVRRKAGKTAAK